MKKKTKVTLQDVSKAAGVSMMTVSNVVKGRAGEVSEDVKKRVEYEIERLNYRPNVSARNLRSSSSHSIGFMISDSAPAFLSDPFISQLVSGLSNYLSSVDYSLDIQGVTPEKFNKANIMRKAGNDALCAILCGTRKQREENLNHLKRLEQPIIVFQEPVPSSDSDITIIRQDDETGANELGKHLISKQVKRVVFIRPTMDWPAIEQREQGLRKAFDEASQGITCETIMSVSEGFQDVKDAVKRCLSDFKPDTIVAATDAMGIAAMRMCEEKGFRVPDDIKIAGFNGFEAWQYTSPTLTTVVSPAYEMGHRAGEILLERLSEGKFKQNNIIFSTRILVGTST